MLKKINKNWEIFNQIKDTKSELIELNGNKLIIQSLILKDMLLYVQIWRQVRGYSSNGQRSHSNNKNNKKARIIVNFRVQQFYKMFGKKRRDIFPTLVLAEYNNRLWFIMWTAEWLQGRKFLVALANKDKKKIVKIDPALLAKNIVTGVIVKKKKKKNIMLRKKNWLWSEQ